MLNDKRVVVVLPAYTAARTHAATYREIPHDVVDDVVLVDDHSRDDTVGVAQQLGIRHVIRHDRNRGYGGNQKTCYATALGLGADVVAMLHPDYQYTPKLLTAMVSVIAHDVYPVVYGSRILGNGALEGGMPLYKYVFNRALTLVQNLLMGQKLSEYHTGYRAFHRKVLEAIDLEANSDDFVFDNQITAQIFAAGFQIGEVTCPTKYFAEASSINFRRSVVYGLGCLRTAAQYRLQQWGLRRYRFLAGRRKPDPSDR